MTKNKFINNDDFFDIKIPNAITQQMKLSLAFNQRKIILYDDIDENSAMQCLYYLHKLVDIDKATKKKLPIAIEINSNGGNCNDGLTLISLIEQLKDDGYEINTINIGRAYSMAFLIALCGTNRYAYRYARYMFHDVSTVNYGKLEQIKEDVKEGEILRNLGANIIKKYSKISDYKLTEMIDKKQDMYLSPLEMLELKGVDKIL